MFFLRDFKPALIFYLGIKNKENFFRFLLKRKIFKINILYVVNFVLLVNPDLFIYSKNLVLSQIISYFNSLRLFDFGFYTISLILPQIEK